MIIFCALLGLLQAWALRLQMSPDGISYIDIAESYLRGDWKNALNAYWSPLYSWVLGIALAVMKPSSRNEFASIHLLNWIVYLFCIGSFELLLSQIVQAGTPDASTGHRYCLRDISPFLWRGVVYLLFLWCTLKLLGLDLVSPDLLVACIVFLASALLVRMQREGVSLFKLILLGAVLGTGYLAKLHMLILSGVYFSCGLFFIRPPGKTRTQWIWALLSFLIVVLPFGLAISKTRGHLTFGEAGKLNYAWWVNGVPLYKHWHPENQDHGAPLHTTRRILRDPAAYEFGRPISGTYPVWYDPVYWNDGIRPRLVLRQQLSMWRQTAVLYVKILTRGFPGAIILGLLICCWNGWLRPSSLTHLQALLIVPSLAAMAMFGCVHVETRFIAPFMALIFLALLSAVRIPDTMRSFSMARRIFGGLFVVLAGTLAINILPPILPRSRQDFQSFAMPEGNDWHVAEALHQAGIAPGDEVALVGNGFYAYWARLARLRIVAEVPASFSESPDRLKEVLAALRKTGARAVVAKRSKAGGVPSGWRKLGDTGYQIFNFRSDFRNSPDSSNL